MRLDEFYNPEDDREIVRSPEFTRKKKLTLKRLNKLRKYRDIKQAEETDHDNKVRTMYAAPPADAGMM